MILFTASCFCLLLVKFSTSQEANEIPNDIRPYEFAFNVVDFLHRFEKKGILSYILRKIKKAGKKFKFPARAKFEFLILNFLYNNNSERYF